MKRIVAMLMLGVASLCAEEQPDFDDPKTIERLLSKAKEIKRRSQVEKSYSGWAKTLYPNGNPAELLRFKAGIAEGPSIAWFKDGKKRMEGPMKAGDQDGTWTFYFPSGRILTTGAYKDGKRHGPWTQWGPNGTKVSEGAYAGGNRNGPWKEWNANGEIRREAEYKDGKLIDE